MSRPLQKQPEQGMPPSASCFLHPSLDVMTIAGKGRGVIAQANITQGSVLEIAPVVLVPHVHMPAYRTLPLFHYSFAWDEGNDAIVFGVASFVNHAREGNVTLHRDTERLAMVMTSSSPIHAGEELRYDYQCHLWFDVKE